MLGVYLTNTFASTAHANHLLTIGNQRLFLYTVIVFKKSRTCTW